MTKGVDTLVYLVRIRRLDEEILSFAQNDGGVMRRFLANAQNDEKEQEAYFAS